MSTHPTADGLTRADLSPFGHVSLDDVNRQAALLDRMENKYLIDLPAFRRMLKELSQQFDILSIDDEVIFNYDTVYFDSGTLVAYRDHAQGRRKRFKIRSRHYVESDLYFFEVKLKGERGRTVKKRIPYDPAQHGNMTGAAQEFVRDCFRKEYDTEFPHEIGPKLTIRYRRLTLVGKRAPERVTIDFDLRFEERDQPQGDEVDGVDLPNATSERQPWRAHGRHHEGSSKIAEVWRRRRARTVIEAITARPTSTTSTGPEARRSTTSEAAQWPPRRGSSQPRRRTRGGSGPNAPPRGG